MTTDLILYGDASVSAPLTTTHAGAAANRAAAGHVFSAYQQRRPANTLRRQRADLDLFATFLHAVGAEPAGQLAEEPEAWAGVTWGLVAAFVQWQLQEGYAIGSINVRLSTVKKYAQLATQAGAVSPAEYALIKTVAGFRHAEGRNVDQAREKTRKGTKKAEATALGAGQALLLKDQADPRDALLICILLDHGLRCGEIAALDVSAIDVATGTLTFYRSKVHKTQIHKLTTDTLRAALQYARGTSRHTGSLFEMTTREINRRVGQLGKAIGIDKLSPHDLRHFWATAAVRGKTDIKSLQDAGGWTSPAMPLRYVESQAIANEGVRLA
jgi:integrase